MKLTLGKCLARVPGRDKVWGVDLWKTESKLLLCVG